MVRRALAAAANVADSLPKLVDKLTPDGAIPTA